MKVIFNKGLCVIFAHHSAPFAISILASLDSVLKDKFVLLDFCQSIRVHYQNMQYWFIFRKRIKALDCLAEKDEIDRVYSWIVHNICFE